MSQGEIAGVHYASQSPGKKVTNRNGMMKYLIWFSSSSRRVSRVMAITLITSSIEWREGSRCLVASFQIQEDLRKG